MDRHIDPPSSERCSTWGANAGRLCRLGGFPSGSGLEKDAHRLDSAIFGKRQMKTAPDFRSQELVAQAAAWRLASLLLERPRPAWKSEVAQLCSEVTERELSSCARAADQGTEELYHRLFGPGGTVSPREVSYCGFEDPGRLMAELSAFYQAFSFQPRREEPVDHICVEVGFVGYLFLKEAYAEKRGASESVEITKSARDRFTDEHVSRCAQGMLDRLSAVPTYLQGVLSWLVENRGLRHA